MWQAKALPSISAGDSMIKLYSAVYTILHFCNQNCCCFLAPQDKEGRKGREDTLKECPFPYGVPPEADIQSQISHPDILTYSCANRKHMENRDFQQEMAGNATSSVCNKTHSLGHGAFLQRSRKMPLCVT